MGNISDYVNEKYVLVSGVGSGILGTAVGTAVAVSAGPLMGWTGIAAGGIAFVLSNVFRPRTQDEINEILKIEPMNLKALPTGAGQTGNPKSGKSLYAHTSAMMEKVDKARESLGEEIVNAAIPVFENLIGIFKQWKKLEGLAETQFTVEAIVYDYLPTSLEAYTNVSKHERATKDASLKKELIEQLNILAAETARIKDNIYAEDLKPLTSQTHFLKARFGADDSPQLSLNSGKVSE